MLTLQILNPGNLEVSSCIVGDLRSLSALVCTGFMFREMVLFCAHFLRRFL